MNRRSITPLAIFIILIIGIVFGGLIAYLTRSVPALQWLSIGYDFGLKSPVILNMEILELTFGINVRINVAIIIGIILSATGYKYIF